MNHQRIASWKGGSLTGESVHLRPVKPEDVACIQRWCNDPEIMKLTGEVEPMSREDAEAYLRRLTGDEDRLWFIVALKENGKAIGEAGLLRIFPAWKTTDLSIIIGEKGEWGKGYGTEAARLLLDHAFGPLGLHRVAIGVVGFNERAISFWEKLGFRREGVQRDGYLHEGRYHDFVMMSILDDEYQG
jgi:RimJ/RimL family protein N-acetyltransferase